MQRLRLALFALCFAPLAASAGDLPVSFTVDDKALKAAVLGTSLTFDVYTNGTCSGTPAHTQAVAIENVDRISKLKLGAPKGAPKPPKTAELEETLSGVSAEGNVYLKVTGTGIVPVGGECQAQAAQPFSPIPGGLVRAISWNPTLTEAEQTTIPPNNIRSLNSSTSFPVGSVVSAYSATLTGNLSGCPNWTAYISVPHDLNGPPSEGIVSFGYHSGANLNDFPAESGLNQRFNVTLFEQILSVAVFCYNGTFNGDVNVELVLDVVDTPAVID